MLHRNIYIAIDNYKSNSPIALISIFALSNRLSILSLLSVERE